MNQQLEQLTDHVCLYYLGYQRRLEQGETTEPFDDVSCALCQPNRQSSILCGHYINRFHLEYFKQFNLTQ